jgi:putative ABC transport system permease protein
MGGFWQDIRFGLRTLHKSAGFTAIAVLTLALGMAANTTMFSVVNAVLLRPLPVMDPGQIVTLTADQKNNPNAQTFSLPEFNDFQKQSESLADLFFYHITLGGLAVDGMADHLALSYVSPNFFPVLGIQPALGRFLLPSEGLKPGADPYIVLSYSYWQKRFGGDQHVIGKQVMIDGSPVTVVGVAPKGFFGIFAIIESQGYMPASMEKFEDDSRGFWTDRTVRPYRVLGRLKPGVSVKQAEASLNVIADRLAQQYPESDKGIGISVYPERLARPQPQKGSPITTVAGIFMILAGLVLLLACFNVANVLLVRATVRQREMAVRAALGAGRMRLVRQFLTESLILALLGGLAGTLLAWWGSGALSSLPLQTDLPIRLDFSPDGRVLGFAFATIFFTGIIVGLLPAWRAARTDVTSVLHEGGRASSDGPRRNFLRDTLVVGQVAGSLVLLIVAGLFARSLGKAQRLDLGLDPNNVLNMMMDVQQAGFDEARGKEFYRAVDARLRALPGVQSATQAMSTPLGYVGQDNPVFVEGRPLEAGQHPEEIVCNTVAANYIDIMRVPLVRGRNFSEADSEKAPLVAIVNQTMGKKYWPNEDPIGKRFSIKAQTGPFLEIVGVVKDGKYRSPNEDPTPFFFLPMEQNYSAFRTIQLRTLVPPETLAVAAQQAIQEISPQVSVFDVMPMAQALNGGNGYFIFRFGAQITTLLGLLGLALAVVGVYGVVSYSAAQRTHEIGIRMALGAGRGDILKMVLRQGLTVVGVGVAAGLLAAFAGTRAIAKLFVGTSPTDPLTYFSVAILLTGVALLACWIPARRATRVDPLIALRYE